MFVQRHLDLCRLDQVLLHLEPQTLLVLQVEDLHGGRGGLLEVPGQSGRPLSAPGQELGQPGVYQEVRRSDGGHHPQAVHHGRLHGALVLPGSRGQEELSGELEEVEEAGRVLAQPDQTDH